MSGSVLPTPMPATATAAPPESDLGAEVEGLTAEESIAWAVERFRPDAAVRGLVPEDELGDGRHRAPDRSAGAFFYVDTGLLFPETYATRDALAERYGIEFERIADLPATEQPEERAANLWRLDPDACCADRKVELMRTALDRGELLGFGNPQGRLGDTSRRPQVRLGRAVRALEAQPPGGLG